MSRRWNAGSLLAGAFLVALGAGCKGPPPGPDMSMEEDLAAPDLASGDLAGAADLLTSSDLRRDDLAEDEDLRAPDLAVPADMRAPDLAVPADMRAPDLAVPADMRTPDMATPDMGTCTGSATCGGATPYCCAEIVLGAGTPPMCPVTSIDIACKSSCNGDIALSCAVTDRARLCDKAADCAGDPGGYKNCCQFNAGMVSARVCITDFLKVFAGPCL